MSPTTAARLTRDDLLRTYATYGRSRARWLLGGEFERHLLGPDGLPAPYDGPDGVRALLQRFVADGWIPTREGAAPIKLEREVRQPGVPGTGAAITLEPGGQFELSGSPYATVAEVVAEAEAFVRQTDAYLADTPYRQVALGYTPFARIEDVPWVPKGRYAIMREHMAAVGTHGHHMMKGTAATQASFDFSDEADCARKMRIGITLAPLVTAMFANSPLTRGRPNGWQSFRGFVWTRTDPARTGFPDAAASFSFERWVDYLLDVPMMFTKVDGRWEPAHGRSFRHWMEHGDAQGRFPTMADWDLHQTSVFPEVRVKHQIEVRMGDCVPVRLSAAFCALFEGLFYCDVSLQQAMGVAARFERYGTKQERFLVACREGLRGVVGGRPLAAWAEELVDAASGGLCRCASAGRPGFAGGESRWLAPLVDLVEHAETPASRLLAALGDEITPDRVRALTHPLAGA
jgi:glutamate--cysteine ligase